MSRAYPGDEVFFHKAGEPVHGKVLSAGKHGCHVEHEGNTHKLKWHEISGYKKRTPQKYSVLQHGEDGLIVQNQDGKKRYIGIPSGAKE